MQPEHALALLHDACHQQVVTEGSLAVNQNIWPWTIIDCRL